VVASTGRPAFAVVTSTGGPALTRRPGERRDPGTCPATQASTACRRISNTCSP